MSLKTRLAFFLTALAFVGLAYQPATSQTVISNNAADMLNHIVMVADSTTPRTVTNLFTFNRSGTNPPFAVGNAGATAVANLDADKLDGHDSTYFSVSAVPDADVQEGRCTLTTATPVTTADVTAATTVYFTPYKGNHISLYDGSATWNSRTFTELSIALGADAASTPYDFFVYDNAGTPTAERLAWTNDTTRATALVYQNGRLVKSGATTRRYVCTYRTTTVVGQTEDSAAKRFVWNYYHRVEKVIQVKDTTASWTYAVGVTWRQARASTANQAAIVQGYAEEVIRLELKGSWDDATNSAYYMIAFGEDSITVPSASSFGYVIQQHTTSVDQLMPAAAGLVKVPAVGYHYYAWLEYVSTGTANVYGYNAAAPYEVAGIHGTWRC